MLRELPPPQKVILIFNTPGVVLANWRWAFHRQGKPLAQKAKMAINSASRREQGFEFQAIGAVLSTTAQPVTV